VLVIIIGIFGAAHQSWSANLFSLVGDNIPKKSIATVIGIGGCAGGIASYLVMVFTGTLLQYANLMHDTFTFLGYSGKAAAYMMMFSIFSVSYLIGWGIIRLLSDYHITKNSIPNHERNN
jgi:ACS family hexuronate transporter-like MFS transporter